MKGVEHVPWAYDTFMALVEPFGLGRWRLRLLRRVTGSTLEVGCGTGRNLPLYARDAAVVALDPDLRILLTARRRASAPLVVASAEALPFRAATFDHVVSSLVFCSVPDPPRGLREVGRVLAARGRLHMMEHVRHHRPLVSRLQDLLQPGWTWISGGCYPNRDTEDAVAAAGFSIDPESRRARGVMRLFTASLKP